MKTKPKAAFAAPVLPCQPPPLPFDRPFRAYQVRRAAATSAESYWTPQELCRLFGIPRVLIDALAPVAVTVADGETIEANASVDVGTLLYEPQRVAVALQEHLRQCTQRRLRRAVR